MAFALVHFTLGFVTVLTVVSVFPLTRYRLTSAYAGGIWALGPDVHQFLNGVLGERIHELHNSPRTDLFFLHYTLDRATYRAHNVELTFLSLAVLGVAYVVYDRRSSAGTRRAWGGGAADRDQH